MAYTENLITIQQQVSNHLLLFHLFSYKYFRFLSLLTFCLRSLYSIYYKHIRSDRSDSKVDFHNFTTISASSKTKCNKRNPLLRDFLTKKFVLSIIIRIFAESVLAKPLNNAQIVRGVFCLYTFDYSESYSLYKTI